MKFLQEMTLLYIYGIHLKSKITYKFDFLKTYVIFYINMHNKLLCKIPLSLHLDNTSEMKANIFSLYSTITASD